jgi:linoleate 10R-lipoxygenase
MPLVEYVHLCLPILYFLITQFQLSISDMMNHFKLSSSSCHNVLKPLWEALGSKYSRAEIAAQIFAAVVPSAALYSQAVATVVHYYLREDKKAELEEIIKLGASPAVMAYVYEALS